MSDDEKTEKKNSYSIVTNRSDNIATVVIVLMMCITCVVVYVVNGEYTLKLETLRGHIGNGV